MAADDDDDDWELCCLWPDEEYDGSTVSSIVGEEKFRAQCEWQNRGVDMMYRQLIVEESEPANKGRRKACCGRCATSLWTTALPPLVRTATVVAYMLESSELLWIVVVGLLVDSVNEVGCRGVQDVFGSF